MPDFMTPAQRSRAMSRVRGNETHIERALRSQLHQQGFRFRKNVKELPGRPDIVLPKYRSVIFVNGCFWHHHANCARAKLPDSRREFWATKIAENVKRDKKQIKALRAQGWKVFIVWECKLRDRDKSAIVIRKIVNQLGEIITGRKYFC